MTPNEFWAQTDDGDFRTIRFFDPMGDYILTTLSGIVKTSVADDLRLMLNQIQFGIFEVPISIYYMDIVSVA